MDGLTDWRFRIYATLSLAWVIRVFVSSSWYSSFWRLASAREGYSDEAISQERLKCRECASSAATEPNLLQRKQRDNVTWLCANFGIKNEVLREMSTNPSPIRLRSVPGHNVFCSACAKNQETVVRLLSCYDPPNSPLYIQMVHDYKTELEERYPLSCSACEERMELYLASERKFLLSSLQKEALGRSRGMTSVGSVPRWSFGKGVGWSLGIGVLILWRVVCLGLFIWTVIYPLSALSALNASSQYSSGDLIWHKFLPPSVTSHLMQSMLIILWVMGSLTSLFLHPYWFYQARSRKAVVFDFLEYQKRGLLLLAFEALSGWLLFSPSFSPRVFHGMSLHLFSQYLYLLYQWVQGAFSGRLAPRAARQDFLQKRKPEKSFKSRVSETEDDLLGIERAFERSQFEDPSSLIWTRYAVHRRIEFTRKVLWMAVLTLSIVKSLFYITLPPSTPILHSITAMHSFVTLTFLSLSGLGLFLHYFSLSHPDTSFLWRHFLLCLLTGVHWTLCHYSSSLLGSLKRTTEWDRVWEFPPSMMGYNWVWIDVSFFASLIMFSVCIL